MRIYTDFQALASLLVQHGIQPAELERQGYRLCKGSTWEKVWHCRDRLAHGRQEAREREVALAPALPRYVRKTMAVTPQAVLHEALKVKTQIRHEPINSLAYRQLLRRVQQLALNVEAQIPTREHYLAAVALDTVATRANLRLRYADER